MQCGWQILPLTSIDDDLYIQYTTYAGGRMRFTWDENKNESNFKNRRVWFEEAATVFADKNALEMFDDDHSEDEDRFVLLGMSSKPRLLIVVHCERGDNEIRIISARKASKKETKDYEKRI
jgi:uncharacterized protein